MFLNPDMQRSDSAADVGGRTYGTMEFVNHVPPQTEGIFNWAIPQLTGRRFPARLQGAA